MSKNGVQFNVCLTIHDGKAAAFEALLKEMIAGTQKEPGALGYEWYLSADGKRCRLVEDYKDADAVVAHIEGGVVRALVPKMLQMSSLDRFEVYGYPGPKAAETLTSIGAEIFQFWHGLGH